MAKTKTNSLWFKALHGISYFLVYILSIEFVLPLKKISNTSRIDGFILFIAAIVLLQFLFRKKYILMLGGLITIHGILFYLYLGQSEASIKDFVVNLYLKFLGDMKLIFLMQWNTISDEFKTTLFLLLLWFVVSTLVYVLNHKKSFLIPIIVSLYLALIDSIFWYDTKWSIIRVVSIGLLLITIEKQRNFILEIKQIKTISIRFILTAQIMILIIVSMGYILPKADAKWESPVTIFESYNGKGIRFGGNVYGFTGYGDDDTTLGGPFKQDETVIMLTTSDRLAYWRGESKDTYTGKGWINSKEAIEEIQFSNIVLNIEGEEAQIDHFLFYENSGFEEKIIKQKLFFPEETFSHMFYAGEVLNVLEIRGDKDEEQINNIYLNTNLGKAETPFSLREYTIESRIPVINIGLLQKSSSTYSELEKEYLDPYLTLPRTLPSRVTDLANQITTSYTNPYDKVTEIRDYLRGNYSYELEDVSIPKENQDFVDQFLFESRVGYCNHFSTSMVVLARSVGIPARWVKGFSPGEVDYNSDTKSFEGVVRNRNAHSWVEVYFSGIGWIPFEPTPSFRYPAEYRMSDVDLNTEIKDDSSPVSNIIENEGDDVNNPLINNGGNYNSKYFKYVLWLLGILLFVFIILLIRYRSFLLFLLLKLRVRHDGPIRQFIIKVTDNMLKRLERKHKEKESSETVREYMGSIFDKQRDATWLEALRVYEEARYSNEDIQESWRNRIWEVWGKIFKRRDS